ncbi:spore germination protein [Paenibacillus macerans]|uniref:GerA spore germination family protein n=2 Tax=Paenibacillus macerans TaxID=44252 RepID=A0A090Y6Q7_PAEMA|nr:GerA spore germination family protein [Paenibacillus macerans]SUD25467.1 GerA spore germination protein [Paenibacillus macerans]
MDILKLLKFLKKADPIGNSGESAGHDQTDALAAAVSDNEQMFKQIFADCSDIVFRPVMIHGQTRLLLIYVDGLVNAKALEQVVLKLMTLEGVPGGLENADPLEELIEEQLVSISRIKVVHPLVPVSANSKHGAARCRMFQPA